LIGPDGNQLGIKPVPEALRMARGLDLDLVEVAPMANPPVCRIMDYGKFRYEEAQKAKEARRKTTHVTIKEVKFRPKIGKGDFDTKMRHLIEFIEDGHKVKVTLQFRGREMAHPELGRKILDNVIETAGPIVKIENQARMEGRSMSLVLSPDKQAMETIKKAAEEAEKQAAAASAAPPEAAPSEAAPPEAAPPEAAPPEAAPPEAAPPEAAPPEAAPPKAAATEQPAEAPAAEAPPDVSGDE
jgi:translation initiation factor IF-3